MKSLPSEVKQKIVDAAITLEKLTSPGRKDDEVILSWRIEGDHRGAAGGNAA
jgi:hypothetical protein